MDFFKDFASKLFKMFGFNSEKATQLGMNEKLLFEQVDLLHKN